MSNVPAKASMTPPHRRSPNAVSTAATKVSAVPTTVIWFGVTGSRWSADIRASAWRRTQASNRVVNIHHLPGAHRLSLFAQPARFPINVHDLRSDLLPGIAARLLQTVSAHPASQLLIAREDDQGRAKLGPTLWGHRQAVPAGLEHRHVSIDLGGDDRQPGRHRFEQDDSKTLRAGRRRAEDVGAAVIARQDGIRDITGQHHILQTVPRDVRLDAAPQQTVADHDEPAVRNARLHELVAAQEVSKALALLEPADEEDVDTVVSQMPDRRVPRMECADVDAIGDDLQRKVRKVALHERLRGFADSNAPMQVGEVWLEQWAAVVVTDVGFR